MSIERRFTPKQKIAAVVAAGAVLIGASRIPFQSEARPKPIPGAEFKPNPEAPVLPTATVRLLDERELFDIMYPSERHPGAGFLQLTEDTISQLKKIGYKSDQAKVVINQESLGPNRDPSRSNDTDGLEVYRTVVMNDGTSYLTPEHNIDPVHISLVRQPFNP